MDESYEREEELKDRQDGQTFRVGRALRGVYDGRPDEVLEPRITRLMLELARLPYGDERPVRAAPTTFAAPPPETPEPSLLRRIAARLIPR